MESVRDTVGRYKLLGRIGSGALGDLFRARDTRAGRTVALRIIGGDIANNRGSLDAILRAARGAATISHPAIAALYEAGDDDGVYYLACEFVDGQTLEAFAAGNPLSPRRAVEIAVELADGLAEAHARELAHGDVKPAHVMITSRGRAKLIDFGLSSRCVERDSWTFDAQDDVVGLGRVLCQMTTGRPMADLGAQPAAGLSIAPPFRTILDKSCSAEPGKSYAEAALFAADLRGVLESFDRR
jgi:serine/threonine protein kinase